MSVTQNILKPSCFHWCKRKFGQKKPSGWKPELRRFLIMSVSKHLKIIQYYWWTYSGQRRTCRYTPSGWHAFTKIKRGHQNKKGRKFLKFLCELPTCTISTVLRGQKKKSKRMHTLTALNAILFVVCSNASTLTQDPCLLAPKVVRPKFSISVKKHKYMSTIVPVIRHCSCR